MKKKNNNCHFLNCSCNNKERMKTLQGLAMCIQCFGGEIPFFFISGWVLKKIGHVNSMTLVLFAFGIRLFLYSLLTNPWWVLPIELMQGITFGIFYSTMATYASIVAPDGTAATLQVRHAYFRLIFLVVALFNIFFYPKCRV